MLEKEMLKNLSTVYVKILFSLM